MNSIKICGRYGHLSRGKTVAKHMASGAWAEREGSCVVLDHPGKWMLHTSDGFARKVTVYVSVSKAGIVSNLGSSFWIK